MSTAGAPSPPVCPLLPPGAELALFRIAQEALTNVAKYAKARHVIPRFAARHRRGTAHRARRWRRHPGGGARAAELARHRRNARAVAAIEGTLHIGAGPGHSGTEVAATIPVASARGRRHESDQTARGPCRRRTGARRVACSGCPRVASLQRQAEPAPPSRSRARGPASSTASPQPATPHRGPSRSSRPATAPCPQSRLQCLPAGRRVPPAPSARCRPAGNRT